VIAASEDAKRAFVVQIDALKRERDDLSTSLEVPLPPQMGRMCSFDHYNRTGFQQR
jgi:hypothetical protein